MITPAEFVQRWGEDEFIYYPLDIVHELNISEASKRFLLEAGLPRYAEPFFVFDVAQNTLPALPAYLPAYNFPPDYARYRMIAEKQHQWLDKRYTSHFVCLDEKQDGQVVWVLNEGDYPVFLLNT